MPSIPNTFIHRLKEEEEKNHSHVPIPDLARAFHMVKVLTVKSAKKQQQQPDVFSLNLKADIFVHCIHLKSGAVLLYILTSDVTVGSTP